MNKSLLNFDNILLWNLGEKKIKADTIIIKGNIPIGGKNILVSTWNMITKMKAKILVLEYNNKNGIKISYSIPHQLTR